MNDEQARERRNDLTRYASRFWAGEAEIARTFFSQPRAPEEHLRWLRVQAYKELQPRPDGIILRNIDQLSDNYPALEQSVSRADFLYNIQFLEEEFRHYVVFADVIDYITGAHLTTTELATYDIEGERELRAVRRRCYDEHGELGPVRLIVLRGRRRVHLPRGDADQRRHAQRYDRRRLRQRVRRRG